MSAVVRAEPASWRNWACALGAAVALGVMSLLVNLTTIGQLEGREQEWFAVRRTLSLLLNSGSVCGSRGWEAFSQNWSWFAVAAVCGPLLGLVGAAAHSDRWFGWLARLVVPAGAIVEPWVRHWWSAPGTAGWPTVVSGWAASVLLTSAGLAGAWSVVSRRSARTG